MSRNPTDPDSFDETLESAHRTLRRLEVDTCRLRTDLTRLEVALEDGRHGPAVKTPLPDDAPLEHEVLDGTKPFEHAWLPPLVTEDSSANFGQVQAAAVPAAVRQ